eukprot:TRINITY_DN6834_c0_g1_i1.p1 TRINITY_DN6834_c0_g1~~TRINITY_DN6834_c0_g1_i1.p1  ORF type:complete len:565 (-),score=150.14 TRINITY_DN6834_c0_g1_i1:301-1995(-)
MAKPKDTSPFFPLTISVPSTRNSEGENPFTLYIVLVKWGENNSWTVSRRFQQFSDLDTALAKKTQSLPPLPKKTWFKSLDPSFIQTRRLELEAYLRTLLQSRMIVNSVEFKSFIELSQNVPGLITHLPSERIILKDPKFGINAFQYDHRNGILVTSSEDTFILSRLDSYITNTRLPWEDQPVSMIPVGGINVWVRDEHFDWNCAASEYYDCQASAIAWDEARRYIFVGLESGVILVYFYDANASKFTTITEIRVHTARVSALIYDKTTDLLFSCSRDKTTSIFSVADIRTLHTTQPGQAWLSSLFFDLPTRRLFVGTYSNTILIYKVLEDPVHLALLHTLEGQRGSVRCLFYESPMRYLFSGGFDYTVCMWDIGVPGKEAVRSRIVAVMRNGPPSKVKSVTYCPATRFVIAGYESGLIGIWNSTTAELMHVIDAHTADVIALQWLPELRLLVSAGRDCDCKFWLFPVDITQYSVPESRGIELSDEDSKIEQELRRRVDDLNVASGSVVIQPDESKNEIEFFPPESDQPRTHSASPYINFSSAASSSAAAAPAAASDLVDAPISN